MMTTMMIRSIALLVLLGVLAIAVQGHNLDASVVSIHTNGLVQQQQMHPEKISPLMRSILQARGGSEEDHSDDEEVEEEDEESDDEEEDDEELSSSLVEQVLDVTQTKVLPVVVEYSKKGAIVAKKASVMVYQAVYRAIRAGLQSEDEDEDSDDESDSDDEDEGESTVVDKILALSKKSLATVQRMVKAALTVPEDDEEASEEYDDEGEEEEIATADGDDEGDAGETVEESSSKEPETTTTTTAASDFGSYLSEAYEVPDLRNTGKATGAPILEGSLQEALQTARQQARMLLVFVPSEKPKSEQGGLSFFGGGKKAGSEENDKVAIESLLSKEVSKAAHKKARKKQQSDDLGSFVIWAAKAGSPEATAAIKRLKVKETSAKGDKRPILCVVYPASASIGSDKIAPKVLAQHHCNPPLKSDSMASWMNALRKRHGKQYEVMQTELKELQLYIERQEGYIDSVQSDNDRKLREAQEEAERKAREVKEAARQAEIDARRQELQQSLPEDVKSGGNFKKIALRFPDGRSGQRGFAADQPISVLFNWVDAMFEIERETVVLTTLNGKQTFSWEGEDNETTLEEAGLKKMTAFRVSQATEEEA